MFNLLKGRHVVLGVSGGISAYKSAALASMFVKSRATVDVVMTESAMKFVGPATFEALTGRPVYTDMFDNSKGVFIPHVNLARKADLMVIAPATGNTIAKISWGVADNLLTSVVLAHDCPVVIAPAMETHMWENPATQENVDILKERGFYMAGPGEGRLASGAYGPGRMLEPEEIMQHIQIALGNNEDLAGLKIVVTAGGTREAIDPIRFIGNHSSGKMGNALATAARDRGANVMLITTAKEQKPIIGVDIREVESAENMCHAVLSEVEDADVLIMAAAVADYTPAETSQKKIKKTDKGFDLKLIRTKDILSEVNKKREKLERLKVVVGFAAETEDLVDNAMEKLNKKNLDMIVANLISEKDSCFGADTNKVTLLSADDLITPLPLMSKDDVSHEILNRVSYLVEKRKKINPTA